MATVNKNVAFDERQRIALREHWVQCYRIALEHMDVNRAAGVADDSVAEYAARFGSGAPKFFAALAVRVKALTEGIVENPEVVIE